ncbi:MAG: DUF2793 domain-containing protein [Xanthobacteraceae bacterium]|nr:MAG: DUF2793 domain-containing protein [Xanthobacteraceae bacterium]
MTAHDAIAACGLNGGAQANKTLTRSLLTTRMPYVLADADDMQSLIALDPATAAAVIDVLFHGRVYHYDATDATTAHDGVTCLVSAEGRRYKLAVGSSVDVYAVLSFSTTAPPGSPALGDAYLLPAGCTGAWAGHEGAIAVDTARGWEYITVPVGRPIYVEDVASFYHRDAAGNWTLGLGTQLFGANAVPPSALLNLKAGGILKVINKTTNAPPGSPAVGDAYVIGAAPTGAWAGKSLQIALCEAAGTWSYYVPSAGDEVYDSAVGAKAVYSGSAWVTRTAGLDLISTQAAAGVASIDFTGLDDTYDTYVLDIASAKPASDGVSAGLRVGTGATPTWVTSGYGYSCTALSDSAVASAVAVMLGNTAARIFLGATGNIETAGTGLISAKVGNASGENFRCTIEFSNPEAADLILIDFKGSYINDTGDLVMFSGSGLRRTAGAITAIRFLFGAGNISTGRFTLYGRRKS